MSGRPSLSKGKQQKGRAETQGETNGTIQIRATDSKLSRSERELGGRWQRVYNLEIVRHHGQAE